MNEISFTGVTENRQWMGTNMETTAQSEGAELGTSAPYVHATARHLPTFLRGYVPAGVSRIYSTICMC